MKRYAATAIAAVIIAMSANAIPGRRPANGYPDFAIGGDVSWMTYLMRQGSPTYYYSDDNVDRNIASIPSLITAAGFDAVRLRVWVNPQEPLAANGFTAIIGGYSYESVPTHGSCSPDEVVAMASRFSRMGLRVMVDFQLSDTWADPARQYIPRAWSGCNSTDALKAKVVEHITSTLLALRRANVNVAWVQIGNETSTGMLKYPMPDRSGATVSEVVWGCGIANNASTNDNFVNVFRGASAAVKDVYPEAKVVLHIAEGNNWGNVDWTLGLLRQSGLTSEICDMIGLSLYPCGSAADYNYTARWRGDADRAIETIAKINERYGYPVMLCEIGMNNEWSLSTPQSEIDRLGSQAANIAQCDNDVRDFTAYLLANLRDKPSACQGVFYWEPEVDYLENYEKGACRSINPGPSWPRDKVAPNPFWGVCREASNFPDGALQPYVIDGYGESAPELYVIGTFNNWDVANPCVMDYDPADCNYKYQFSGGEIAVSTSADITYKQFRIAPVAPLTVGESLTYTSADKIIATPYQSEWELSVNTDLMTMSLTDKASVGQIEADGQSAEYYDIMGRKVSPDGLGAGVYIRRQGMTTRKVAIR